MSRSWLAVLFCCTAPDALLAQCGFGGPNPTVPVEIVASAIGQKGLGGIRFTMMATCPGDVNARMKFKLDTSLGIGSGMIVSPSNGTTPLEIQVGVSPSLAANALPGEYFSRLDFITVDQTPPLNANVLLKIIFTRPDPPVPRWVGNAASSAPVVSPGAVVLIRGASLGPNISATLDRTGLYPTTLGNTTVTFNGIPAPLLSSSPTVIKAVAPYGLAGQNEAQVLVWHPGSQNKPQVAVTVPVAEASLAIFSRAQTAELQNDIQNCDADGCSPNSAENPAAPGLIITLFATGAPSWAGTDLDGAVAILPRVHRGAALTIGGQPAQVLYAGVAPYQVYGVFQVNARVPESLGPGPQPLLLTVGEASNAGQRVVLFVR